MSWKRDSGATFTGGSGQMAVMGELLHRKCNSAVPHVDVGMDVFAFRDDREEVARIQVKTAPGTRYKKGGGFYARPKVKVVQLRRTDSPPLYYALAIRLEDGWGSFIVISRAELKELWNEGCGSEQRSGDLELYVKFRPAKEAAGVGEEAAVGVQKLTVHCGKFDLTDYINDWESLPPLKTPETIDAEAPAGGKPQ